MSQRKTVGFRFLSVISVPHPCYPCVNAVAPSIMCVELSCNYDALNFRRPFVNLGDLRIAKITLDGIVLHISISAEDLNSLVGAEHRRLARHELRHRACLFHVRATVARIRSEMQQRAARAHSKRHVGELELNRLEISERRVKLPTLGGVCSRSIGRRTSDSNRLRCNSETAAVERLHRVYKSEMRL